MPSAGEVSSDVVQCQQLHDHHRDLTRASAPANVDHPAESQLKALMIDYATALALGSGF